jgi:hypothetical protein
MDLVLIRRIMALGIALGGVIVCSVSDHWAASHFHENVGGTIGLA